jgi:hypothetical protein
VGYLEINVLKIMNARTAHDDAVVGHDWAVTGHTESAKVVSESFYYNPQKKAPGSRPGPMRLQP